MSAGLAAAATAAVTGLFKAGGLRKIRALKKTVKKLRLTIKKLKTERVFTKAIIASNAKQHELQLGELHSEIDSLYDKRNEDRREISRLKERIITLEMGVGVMDENPYEIKTSDSRDGGTEND